MNDKKKTNVAVRSLASGPTIMGSTMAFRVIRNKIRENSSILRKFLSLDITINIE